MRILIAEDDTTSALLLRKTLESDGYTVTTTRDGIEALDAFRKDTFDAVVTDWMMPNMDGISLVRRVRAEFDAPPPMLVVTALSSADARAHALEAGADDYLAKPYEPREVLRRLRNCIDRAKQPPPGAVIDPGLRTRGPAPVVSHVGVGIAASTGGPEALRAVMPRLDASVPVAYFLVLHGPGWMLETFAERAAETCPLAVSIAEDGETVRSGSLYVCPGEVHMKVEGSRIALTNEPPENFVRPAADPLFRSIAATYGPKGIAVVLTGMGRDGSLGAHQVHHAGGRVLVQDPTTAVAASMPRTTVGLGCVDEILSLDTIAAGIATHVRALSARPETVRV